MKVGDYLDPIALGYMAIDVKTIMKNLGYVVPQSSAAGLTKLPSEVQSEMERQIALQTQYKNIGEPKEFICPHCKERNFSDMREETDSKTKFFVCGSCNKVTEVL